MNTTTAELWLALCPECGCGRWLDTSHAVDLWLKFHPHLEESCT